MIVENDKMLVAWVNTEQKPIKVEHICYYPVDGGENVRLCQVVREYYPHPTHPEYAQVCLTNVINVAEFKKTDVKSGKIMSLLYAENGLRDYYHERSHDSSTIVPDVS